MRRQLAHVVHRLSRRRDRFFLNDAKLSNLENYFGQSIICRRARSAEVRRQWLCRRLCGIDGTKCFDAWLVAGWAMDERRPILRGVTIQFGSELDAAGGDDGRAHRHPGVAITGIRRCNWRQERHRDHRNSLPDVHCAFMHNASCRTAIDDGFRILTARRKKGRTQNELPGRLTT